MMKIKVNSARYGSPSDILKHYPSIADFGFSVDDPYIKLSSLDDFANFLQSVRPVLGFIFEYDSDRCCFCIQLYDYYIE